MSLPKNFKNLAVFHQKPLDKKHSRYGMQTRIFLNFCSDETMDKIATKSSWENHPIKQPVKIDVSMFLSDEQYCILCRGLIPQSMDDRWFVYFEDDWLYFHRSWTGVAFCKALLVKERNGASIKELWVDQDGCPSDPNEIDLRDVNLFIFLIAYILLEIDVFKYDFDMMSESEHEILNNQCNFANLKKIRENP